MMPPTQYILFVFSLTLGKFFDFGLLLQQAIIYYLSLLATTSSLLVTKCINI